MSQQGEDQPKLQITIDDLIKANKIQKMIAEATIECLENVKELKEKVAKLEEFQVNYLENVLKLETNKGTQKL
jgi:predicted S18 family serine protease